MIQTIIVGPLNTNCYILLDEESQEGIIIDPGDDPEKIIDFLKENPIKIKYIVNTHNHSDHIGADEEIKLFTGAQILIHQKDARILNIMLSVFADNFLGEQDKIKVGSFLLDVLHTPGHTPGSICLLGESFIFTGDTLFAGTVGRCDLPGGSEEKLKESIRLKLMSLSDDLIVYPGHGRSTTIGKERKDNPYFK